MAKTVRYTTILQKEPAKPEGMDYMVVSKQAPSPASRKAPSSKQPLSLPTEAPPSTPQQPMDYMAVTKVGSKKAPSSKPLSLPTEAPPSNPQEQDIVGTKRGNAMDKTTALSEIKSQTKRTSPPTLPAFSPKVLSPKSTMATETPAVEPDNKLSKKDKTALKGKETHENTHVSKYNTTMGAGKGTTTTMLAKQSFFIRHKIVENEQQEQRLMKNFALATIILVVLVVVIVAIVVSVILSGGDTAPDKKYKIPNPVDNPDDPIPNMTLVCQLLLDDECSYFPYKFVSDCVSETCYSIKLQPVVTSDRQLMFQQYNNTSKIKVPNGAPCKSSSLDGWCVDGSCKGRINPRLQNYINLPLVNGDWSTWNSIPNCIAELNFNGSGIKGQLNWKTYLTRTDCIKTDLWCVSYKYVFRSCINPLPANNGSLCWNNKNLAIEELPINLGGRCSDCPEKSAANKKCDKISTPQIDGTVADDFYPCEDFSDHSDFIGLCVLGRCVPFAK